MKMVINKDMFLDAINAFDNFKRKSPTDDGNAEARCRILGAYPR